MPLPRPRAGRNSLSQSEPPALTAATRPVNTSAAATGVPKRAPTVAAAARSIATCGDTCGISRAKIATMIAQLIAMIGFSGPRLTPPARPSRVTSARPGSVRSGKGLPMSSVVAESGPPCPGRTCSAMPIASPVTVSTRMIHQPFGSTLSAPGSVSQITFERASANRSRVHRISAETTPTRIAGTASSRSRRGCDVRVGLRPCEGHGRILLLLDHGESW